ncbi:hypothetical protein EZI54_06870 [Marinobacter halodurans]|uniref:Type II secretion system protein n=1 Tax=Marinobacter halodurans TaxID=2528979 RepID=A0ABY1ZM76_9GAMM|nr:hypothetical protein [Marinobacter halodurans]TBW57373.1 hypothetical protein EZI54_06870 [Marinobacter halodurans]
MRMTSPNKEKGSFLIGAMIFVAAIGAMLVLLRKTMNETQEQAQTERQGRYMADYLNALAGFMADTGQTPPDPSAIAGLSAAGPNTFTASGTEWLKNNTCGGSFDPDESFLGCSLPANFANFYGLGAPIVTFDYTSQPRATISFGIVQDNGPDPIKAGALVRVIGKHLEAAGYQHINVFHIANADNSDVLSANLRAEIDSQSASDIYVRRDGVGEMTGPLLTRHDNWALIARDKDGNETSAEQDPKSSVNINDGYVRSAGAWLSETHKLAEEAYARAIQSPQFMTEGPSGTTVDKPSCPGSLTPQIFATPSVFIGGTASGSNRFMSGVKRIVTDNGSSWTVRLYMQYDGSSGWREVPVQKGRVKITTKCS